MTLTGIEQLSDPAAKVWAGAFAPVLSGATLSLPAWRLTWPGGFIDLPPAVIDLVPDPAGDRQVWLYAVPSSDGADNYHLDEAPLDGVSLPEAAEPFPAFGPLLILWGVVPGVGDADLYYLRHVPESL